MTINIVYSYFNIFLTFKTLKQIPCPIKDFYRYFINKYENYNNYFIFNNFYNKKEN